MLPAQVLRLELNHDLLEQDADQLVVLQIYQGVRNHTFVAVRKDPVEGVRVVRGQGLT